MEKLKAEADRLGKSSFAFAFYMDRQKEERERGVTISCTTKEFFTEKWHYTIIDAPGHRDFIKNMISGAAQADVCCLMVPADGNFTTAIQKGNHKAGEVQGQSRSTRAYQPPRCQAAHHWRQQDGHRHRRPLRQVSARARLFIPPRSPPFVFASFRIKAHTFYLSLPPSFFFFTLLPGPATTRSAAR